MFSLDDRRKGLQCWDRNRYQQGVDTNGDHAHDPKRSSDLGLESEHEGKNNATQVSEGTDEPRHNALENDPCEYFRSVSRYTGTEIRRKESGLTLL